MKATIEFDLNDEDDKKTFEMISRQADYASFVCSYYEEILHPWRKYGAPEQYKDVDELLEHLALEYFRLKEECNLPAE